MALPGRALGPGRARSVAGPCAEAAEALVETDRRLGAVHGDRHRNRPPARGHPGDADHRRQAEIAQSVRLVPFKGTGMTWRERRAILGLHLLSPVRRCAGGSGPVALSGRAPGSGCPGHGIAG